MAIPYDPVALCNTDDVRRYLDDSTSSIWVGDDLCRTMINHITKVMQGGAWLHRDLERKQRTEVFDGGCSYVQVKAPPISLEPTDILNVWQDSDREFTDTTKILSIYDDYFFPEGYEEDHDKRSIIKRTFNGAFLSGYAVIRVQYVGGLITPSNNTDSISADVPRDLRNACAMQVAAWYSNRSLMNGKSFEAGPLGQIDLPSDPTRFQKQLRDVAIKYKIFR